MPGITIHRPPSIWMDRNAAYRVHIDGRVAGKLWHGGNVYFNLPAGDHRVRLSLNYYLGSNEVQVSLPTGHGVTFVCERGWPILGLPILDALFNRKRYLVLRSLSFHDAELLTERLAMCISSNDPHWLAEYAEWIGPIYRRRGVPLADLATICEGIRVATTRLGPAEADARDHSLDAAVAVFRKNGRLAGDRHKRNALLRWLYRGV